MRGVAPAGLPPLREGLQLVVEGGHVPVNIIIIYYTIIIIIIIIYFNYYLRTPCP